ncbi:MAG: YqaJ viral recombinase family protein [Proteobacteria bacterium]|nr:YqaJ viral recombinase family protein [Pseudomonadota bacterium]
MHKTTELRQGTAEWLDARRNLLTGSNFSAAMGVNRYKSRAALWREYKNLVPSFTGNAATRWGQENEPHVIAGYEKARGCSVVRTGLHIHSSLDWMGCSPDGLIDGDGGIEIKCPYNHPFPHQAIPEYYMPQVQGFLEITQREWCDYVCWTPNGTTCFRVFRSQEYWNWAFPLLREFWLHVIEDRIPTRLERRPVFDGRLPVEETRIEIFVHG